MKKLWSNLDFKNYPITTKWVMPLFSLAIIASAVYRVMTDGWIASILPSIVVVYILCNYVMYVQIKIPKKYAIFLLVFGVGIGMIAAYSMWTQDWDRGITTGFLALYNLHLLKTNYKTNGETAEEEQ